MAGSNWTQLLPHESPPPDQVEKQWWSAVPVWGGLGVGEVMNDTPLVLKGCMTVVTLTLILQYVVCSWSTLKGRGGGGKVRCHWWRSTFQMRWTVDHDGGGTLLVRAIVVVIPLLLVIAGDVETNPGPGGTFGGRWRAA